MARSVVCDVMMIVIGVIILYGRLLRLRCLATALIALPQAGRVYLSLSVCLYGCVCLWLYVCLHWQVVGFAGHNSPHDVRTKPACSIYCYTTCFV